MLKSANARYRTAHFGKWDFRFDQVSPAELGYDESDGVTGNVTGGQKGSGGPAARDDPKLVFGVTGRACDFIERAAKANAPFFVQVSHYAVHLDIFYRQQSLEAVGQRTPGEKHTLPEFAAMTSDLDTAVGQLLDKLDSLGLADRTYIFFMSDNGGRLNMPGQLSNRLPRNYPLRGGKGRMYEGGIRVPFVVAGPGVAAGSVCRVPVTGLDLFPTLAELAGYDSPLPDQLDGGSLTGLLQSGGQGHVERQQPFLVFHQAVKRNPQSALIQGDYKLVKTWQPDRLELFDLAADVGESKNLAESRPEVAARLHRQLVGFLNQVGAETRQQ